MKVSALDVKAVTLEVQIFNYLKKVLKKFEKTEFTKEEKTKFFQIFLDDLSEETRITIEKELNIPNQLMDEVLLKNFGSISNSVIENPKITLEKLIIRYYERILQKFEKFEIVEEEISKFLNIFLYPWNMHSIERNIVANISMDEDTPSRILDELAKDEVVHKICPMWAVQNPSISVETLKELSKEGKSNFVYYSIVCNPKATAEIIDNLLEITTYKKEDAESRGLYYKIARHKNTSEQTLERLIEIDEHEFHCDVADNLNASAELIDMLSIKYFSSWMVIESILKNPKIKIETLDRIIMNYESEVMKEIARRIKQLKLKE